MKRVVCPGSFDPLTHGHLDIITRASALFDEVVVAIGRNSTKNNLFSADERVEMVVAATGHLPNVVVEQISGLLVDFCAAREASGVVKGLRFASDFDYELQMAQMNKQLSGIETVLLPTSSQWGYVSSTMIREVATLGGDVSTFVPPTVAEHITALLARRAQEEKR